MEVALPYIDNDPLNNTVEEKCTAVNFLTSVWIYYPIYIEETLSIANTLLDILKRAMRDHSQILKIISVTQLFRLLDYFASERNPYASVIYKKLTFSLMEEHANVYLRDIFL